MRVEYFGYVNDGTKNINELVMINIETLAMVRVPMASVKQTLLNGKEIIGLKLVNGAVKAEHGDIKKDYNEYVVGRLGAQRYIENLDLTVMYNRVLVRKIYKTNNMIVGYNVVNCMGVSANVDIKDIEEAKCNISAVNGKFSGTKFTAYYNDVTTEQINIVDKSERSIVEKSQMNTFRKNVRALPQSESKMNVVDETCGLTLIEKLTSAMMSMKTLRPYYYSAITAINRVESYDLKTFGVTLDTLYINPDFALRLGLDSMLFVLMHEVCHLVMMHRSRRMNRDHDIWNDACDLYINRFIAVDLEINMENGYRNVINVGGKQIGIMLPGGALYDEKIDIDKDTPESIYDKLMENKQNNGENEDRTDSGIYGGDLVDDDKSSKMTNQQIKQAQQNINRRIKQIAIQTGTARRGNGAGMFERELEKTLVEKVDWKKVFRHMLSVRYENITSFSNPDRRFIGRGKVLPGNKKYEEDGITKVHIYIDTSGSISDKDLYICLRQAQDLMKEYKAKAKVCFWDTIVQNTMEFDNPKKIMAARPKGGGGTEINCVFEYEDMIEEKDKSNKSDIILVWTDGCFGIPKKEYKAKYSKRTVFVVNERNEAFKEPFGKKAYFKR